MKPARRKRLIAISFLVIAVAMAIGLVLYALRQNINLFYTPSQVFAGEVPKDQQFRIGGLVEKGSVKRDQTDLTIYFQLSDQVHAVTVKYTGILPDLFREGQGIVATGKLNAEGVFVADQILAKHDEKYTPPEVKYSLEKAGK